MVLIRLLGGTPLIFGKVLAGLGNSNSMDLPEWRRLPNLSRLDLKTEGTV